MEPRGARAWSAERTPRRRPGVGPFVRHDPRVLLSVVIRSSDGPTPVPSQLPTFGPTAPTVSPSYAPTGDPDSLSKAAQEAVDAANAELFEAQKRVQAAQKAVIEATEEANKYHTHASNQKEKRIAAKADDGGLAGQNRLVMFIGGFAIAAAVIGVVAALCVYQSKASDTARCSFFISGTARFVLLRLYACWAVRP